MIHFLCNGKQQLITDGYPNLRKYCILTRSAETSLVGELCKAHDSKQISAFEPDGMSIVIESLYAFVELISWYERYNLSEYSLPKIPVFCFLQYDLQKYKNKFPKNNVRINH